MKKNNCALRRYYREIRSFLPVSRKQKNKVIADLQGSIDAYLDANPEADMQAIQAHFGTPNSIAAAYVDNADTADLLRDLRVRKKILAAVFAGVLVVVLILTAVVVREVVKYDAEIGGSITESIKDNGSTEIVPYWYEYSNSTTRSGATATTELTMGLKGIFGITVKKYSYTITLTCDKNGNLS